MSQHPTTSSTSTEIPAVLGNHRGNNLDFLRLVGAAFVIIGHATPLIGRSDPPVLLGQPVHGFGVTIFFCISGYLITASWGRTRNPLIYLTARVLRIFPALFAVVLASVFVIGPLLTQLSTHDYFTRPQTWRYLHNLYLEVTFRLPGVFTTGPYRGNTNGSLWTLWPEFVSYLTVPLLFLVPRRLRGLALVGVIAGCFWLNHYAERHELMFMNQVIAMCASVWIYFAGGALWRLISQRWQGVFRADVAVAVFVVHALVISVLPGIQMLVGALAIPYLVLTVGLANTPFVRRASRYGDLSYGLYLWAFPVQQIVYHFGGVQPWWLNLPIVFAVTTALAYLSWHLVENPSLRLKSRITSALAPTPS